MAPTIPDTEPTDATAGTSWFWDRVYSDYPASAGWELSYHLRGQTDLNADFGDEVTADGDGFEIRIPAADTAALPADGYDLIGVAQKDGEKHVVYRGRLSVQQDPTAGVGAKSFNRQMLEALEASTLSANGQFRLVTVSGRTVEYAIDEFEKRLAHYRLLVEIERNPDARLEHEVHFTRA